CFGLIFGLIFGLLGELSVGLLGGLVFGLLGGLVFGLLGGLETVNLDEKNFPNQSVRKSLRNSFAITLSIGLIVGLIVGLLGGLGFGLLGGLSVGLWGGLLAVIKHYTLRFLLAREGSFPWDCVRFLDHAAKHRFIQRVGGRYRFMHDLLRKHFAYGELPSFPSR
ncbi:MAG: hypothetical protein F6K42_37595, partial [Leptolyngbya sp. SIO1D8]|nr:hypothetical protein [Leptolyngbya sp. SIO1D8]